MRNVTVIVHYLISSAKWRFYAMPRQRFHFITLSVSCVPDRWRVTLIYPTWLEVFAFDSIHEMSCKYLLHVAWQQSRKDFIQIDWKYNLCCNVLIHSSFIQTALHKAPEPRQSRNPTFLYIFHLWSAHWMTMRPLTLKLSQRGCI